MRMLTICLLASVLICSTGCATLFKGYEDEVTLRGAPENIRVVASHGSDIPVLRVRTNRVSLHRDKQGNIATVDWNYENRILLRSNREHLLILKHDEKEKTVAVYPKIGVGWAILDVLFGGLPAFIDIYTGNWNHFDDIDATFK